MCVNDGEHVRELSPSIAYKCSCKFKKIQALLQALFYWKYERYKLKQGQPEDNLGCPCLFIGIQCVVYDKDSRTTSLGTLLFYLIVRLLIILCNQINQSNLWFYPMWIFVRIVRHKVFDLLLVICYWQMVADVKRKT